MLTQSRFAVSALFGILLLWLNAGAVSASPIEQKLAAPQKVIDDISRQLSAILATERERLKKDPTYVYRLADEVLAPHVDFDRVSRLVLGKYWRRATPEQRQAFEKQFKRLLVRTYSTAFTELESNWKIQYLPLRVNKKGNEVIVRTKVHHASGEPLDVSYRMRLEGGQWKAYDVKIEGVSLVTNYRSTFANELRRSGVDGLIQKISRLNDQREKKKIT